MIAKRNYNITRLFKRILLAKVYSSFFITSNIRIKLLRIVGVHIGKNCFIGQFVLFDDLYPKNIYIGDNSRITAGTKILTHFYNIEHNNFEVGEVHIGNNCFIGMNTLITKPVTIGDGTTIGAGSVITKDIPENVVAAGVPCKVIKDRN